MLIGIAEDEKARNKQLKEEAKARYKEEKTAKREEHHTSDDRPGDQHYSEGKSPEEKETQHKRRISRPFTPKIQTKGTSTTSGSRNEASPLSPVTSPESANESAGARVKNWLRSRLHKPRAKSISVISKSGKTNGSDKGGNNRGGGFIGGHALTRFHHADGTGSMTSLSESGTRSMREVALAGQPFSPSNNDTSSWRRSYGRVTSNPDSFVSGSDGSNNSTIEEAEEQNNRESRARTKPAPLDIGSGIGGVVPPRPLVDPARITPRSSGSPNRDSKFIEIME